MGLNPGLVRAFPVVGQKSNSRFALYHQGNLPGATSAVYLFPETNSGVVVLANAYGLSDVPDWISQAITSTLFDDGTPADEYARLAQEAVTNNQQYLSQTVEALRSLKQPNPEERVLGQYSGKYVNDGATFFLEIYEAGGRLRVAFQGQPEEEFFLEPLYEDVFSWFPSSLEIARRGRYAPPVSYYLLSFYRDAFGAISKLRRPHSEGDGSAHIFTNISASQLPRSAWKGWDFGLLSLLLVSGVVVILYRRS
jgi:hypothetical protein